MPCSPLMVPPSPTTSLKDGADGLGQGLVPNGVAEASFQNVDVQVAVSGMAVANAFKSDTLCLLFFTALEQFAGK